MVTVGDSKTMLSIHRNVSLGILLQGCGLEAPGCHRQLTFSFGRLEYTYFIYTLVYFRIHFSPGHPRFNGWETLGLPVIVVRPQPCIVLLLLHYRENTGFLNILFTAYH